MNNNIISVIKDYDNYATITKEYDNYLQSIQQTTPKYLNAIIIMAVEKVMRIHSLETYNHAENMIKIVTPLAKALNLSKEDSKKIKLIAKLHDIGKLSISQSILNKKSPLDDKEWNIIKTHLVESYKIVRCIDCSIDVAKDILHHHERYDGTGYPNKLKGEEIPYLSRVIAVVDAYEAMLNGRIYKQPRPNAEVIAEIKHCSGTQFDPNIVKVFVKTFDKQKNKEDFKNL